MELLDEEFLERLGEDVGDPELIVEMLGMFRDELPQRLAAIEDSLNGGDYPEIRRAAHGLASPSATMGVLALCEAARALERSQGADDVARREMAARITQVAAATDVAIEEYRGKSPRG